MSTLDARGGTAEPASTSFAHHPAIAAALAFAAPADDPDAPAPTAPTAAPDHRVLREQIEAGYAMVGALLPPHPEITRSSHTTRSADGAEIGLEWFSAPGPPPGPAVVHAHGGGFIGGSTELFAPFVADYVARSAVPFLSVNYRLAPQAQDTAPAEDVFAGLAWLRAHAEQLGVDPERVAVLGDSAGAGLAAGAAILARERGVRLARQMLIYPMLDDRTTTDPLLEPFLSISADFSSTGWRALLGDAQGSDTVSPVAAPGRLQDFTGLAPAYIEIGELDLFRQESVAYAQRLWAAGVSTELHVRPGLPHGFDNYALGADVTERAMADRVEALRAL